MKEHMPLQADHFQPAFIKAPLLRMRCTEAHKRSFDFSLRLRLPTQKPDSTRLSGLK